MLLVSLSLYSSTQRASLWQGSEHVEVAHAKYGNHFAATAEAGTESRAPKLTLFAAPSAERIAAQQSAHGLDQQLDIIQRVAWHHRLRQATII